MQILLIDDRVPDPNFGAGFPRAYRLLLTLRELGHKIIFIPTVKASIPELNQALLLEYGVQICENVNDLANYGVDVAILSRPHNVHYYLPFVQKLCPNAKIIYDTEALWFRRYDLQLSITGRLPSWAYRYDELGLAKAVDLCFVVNDIEKRILEGNGSKVIKLAHALDIHTKGLSFEQRNNFLVVGGILEEESSNEDGLWWYLENCWHGITTGSMNVTGKASAPRLVNHTFANVNLLGHVNDLVPLYETHKVFVAATRFATGIPWKVHEAMAHGIPCVISQLLADQLEIQDGTFAMVARDPQEFIDKSNELYSNKDLWNKIRQNGFELIRRDCDVGNFKNILSNALTDLAGGK